VKHLTQLTTIERNYPSTSDRTPQFSVWSGRFRHPYSDHAAKDRRASTYTKETTIMLRRTFMTTAALITLGTGAFAAAHSADKDIVDTAIEAGNFTTLVAAVEAAGLVDTLKGEGPFTVFAPTDEAFAALPEGTVEGLLQDPEALAKILTYHVVPGAVMAADLTDGMTAATVEGQDVTFTVGDTVMVNDATVSTADIAASNGVIHVIDSVILPPM
jgi:uncharacterized surface protein with fasciclin (FAS1) repeats